MESSLSWRRDHRLWIEVFALLNLAGLAPDIYLAHSTNSFRHPAEYVPLIFSLAAPLALLPAMIFLRALSRPKPWRILGYIVGWAAVAVGVAGLVLHLESQFFQERTLASLVYSAPFAAPLAYTGLGLLLIMNRMVPPESTEWPLWVLLLALGGFVGNFVFSLTDHAENGFFYRTEWIPVVSSAFAVGFLVVPLMTQVRRSYLCVSASVMAIQAVVGLVGFYFHLAANIRAPGTNVFDKLVYGAPVLAPLLFPDLVLLALMGMWVLHRGRRSRKMVNINPVSEAD